MYESIVPPSEASALRLIPPAAWSSYMKRELN